MSKFALFYDPNCYLLLFKAMDLTNLGRTITNSAEGLGSIACDPLIIGVKQDLMVSLLSFGTETSHTLISIGAYSSVNDAGLQAP